MEKYTKTIGTHFLSMLVNADDSGLSREEVGQVNEWLNQFDGSVAVVPDEDDSFFGRCDICRLKADVIECTVLVYPNVAVK